MQLAGHDVGLDRPMFLIAGPCVIESPALTEEIAGRLKEITGRLAVPFVFKASYDKANRSSRTSFRGLGIEAGLKVLEHVRSRIGVPVLTDVHEDSPLAEVAAVLYANRIEVVDAAIYSRHSVDVDEQAEARAGRTRQAKLRRPSDMVIGCPWWSGPGSMPRDGATAGRPARGTSARPR